MSDDQGTKRVIQLLVRVADSFDLHDDQDREFFLDDVRSVVSDSGASSAMVEVLGLREVSTHYPEMVSQWVGEHDRNGAKHDDKHEHKSARTSAYRMISRVEPENIREVEERLKAIIEDVTGG